MEFKSLQELIRIVENSLAIQFYGQSTVLRKTVLKVLAHVLGGALYMVILIAKRIWKNRFVSTCDVSALEGFGTEYGIPHKVPLKSSGTAAVTLEESVSTVTIPQGTVLVDEESGIEYEVPNDVIVDSEHVGIPVVALDVGKDSDLGEGVPLVFRDGAVAGVASVVSELISGGVADPVEVEGDIQVWGELAEDYRARLLDRIQNPVHGGAANDYYGWATKFSFVTDAFIFPNHPETNSVSVALANYNSANIVPTEDQVAEVKSYIEDDARRPVTADVRVFAVTPVPVTITASVAPYNQYVRESVTTAIKQYLQKMQPGTSVDFETLRLHVLSNSTAKNFFIQSVTKSGSQVQVLEMDLDFSGESPVAEVSKIEAGGINLLNGDV